MADVEGLFKTRALSAAAHRAADMTQQKRKRKEKHHYVDTEHRNDWHTFYEHLHELQKSLGPEQRELCSNFEGMVIEASFGAVMERTKGKHDYDARTHWWKYNAYVRETEAIYKGKASFDDIKQMITEAAWGAANERAFGASSTDAKNSWAHHEAAAKRVLEAGNGKSGEL